MIIRLQKFRVAYLFCVDMLLHEFLRTKTNASNFRWIDPISSYQIKYRRISKHSHPQLKSRDRQPPWQEATLCDGRSKDTRHDVTIASRNSYWSRNDLCVSYHKCLRSARSHKLAALFQALQKHPQTEWLLVSQLRLLTDYNCIATCKWRRAHAARHVSEANCQNKLPSNWGEK